MSKRNKKNSKKAKQEEEDTNASLEDGHVVEIKVYGMRKGVGGDSSHQMKFQWSPTLVMGCNIYI